MKYTKIGLPRTPRDSVLVSVLGCPPQEEIYLAMVAKTARKDEHTHATLVQSRTKGLSVARA